MAIKVPSSGPPNAKVMVVGEAPGEMEERQLAPFVGASGMELNRMLNEAGLLRSQCFLTNLCKYRPPRNKFDFWLRKSPRFPKKPSKEDEARRAAGIEPKTFVCLRDMLVDPRVAEGFEELKKEISLVHPEIIITVGGPSTWALTGRWGITKWRGSMLWTDLDSGQPPTKVIPTYHPAAILRQWDWRAIAVNDLRRAARFRNGAAYPTPDYRFILRPSYSQVEDVLRSLIGRASVRSEPLRVSFDIETRAGHIACAGISWSPTDALCIPFMCLERREGYWDLEQESGIVQQLSRLLTHPNVRVVGQNILYDSQYTWRWWHFVPKVDQDTMISQHSIFSDMPKSLAFQASMYANYYVFWKDEGKDWEKDMREDQLWHYNCLDCVYTEEVGRVELETVRQLGLQPVHDFQQAMFWPVLQAMQRGIRIDRRRRDELILEVQVEIQRRQNFIDFILRYSDLGFSFNVDSPKQMHDLFYSKLNMPVQWKRGKPGEPQRPTLEDEALDKLSRLEPLLRPLVNSIRDIRTLSKFLSNFLLRPLDTDGRMRCAFNIGGSAGGKSAPKTYRLSSSENAFGSGTNLQNIPSEKSKSIGKAAARGAFDGTSDPYQFPNIREIFVPDPGYTWFDLDLERADLFVVCWEADDAMLKAAMRMGADIHLLNSFVLDGREPPPLEELVESHPKYGDHRGPRKHLREFAKVFCHGTNYGGKPPTMAAHTGRTIIEVERAQRLWFGAHPGILRWHQAVHNQVIKRRYIENHFGYRWYIFDRVESIIPEALAWIPQSTVSIVINRIWERLYREAPAVQVLAQVHDSLPGQFQTSRREECLTELRRCAKVTVPYPDPLTIPVSIKTSEVSWGHCQ
jgi:uracil-DNA glycosylase/DNA polymerase I-like protein with 3'-5' exonuclease and polymerase domains